MNKAVFCLATNDQHAQRIVDHLRAEGFEMDQISILLPDRRSDTGLKIENARTRGTLAHEKHTKAPEGAATGALSGGILGGSLGLLAGMGALAIPGLGPFIAAGPLLAALAGSALGGSFGLLVGALVGMGIPEYEAKRYQDSLKAGGVLISVHVDTPDEVDQAIDILKKEDATDISTSLEKAKASGY
jgi:hypothetical protein